MEIWGRAADGQQVVRGNHPPELDEHSEAVLEFYGDNVSSFVQEFGLMPDLVKELGMVDEQRILFMKKMNMIYEHALKMARKDQASA